MEIPLTELCAELRNYFVVKIHNGRFTINGGELAPLDFLQKGQYFRIVGSVFNDGVYKFGDELNLTDEVFEGAVWSMAVPKDVIDLAKDIEEYNKSEQGKPSAYQSENYPNGYSYTKATDEKGIPLDWKSVFSKRLSRFRRVSIL